MTENNLINKDNNGFKKMDKIKDIKDTGFSFRLQAKFLLLTYSQVGSIELKNFVLGLIEKVNNRFPYLNSYVGVLEHHEDKGRHFHIVLEFKDRINLRDEKFFDFLDLHPNITRLRSPKNGLTYVLKEFKPDSNPSEDVLITNIELEVLRPSFGIHAKKDKPKSFYLACANVLNEIKSGGNSSLKDQISLLVKTDPQYMIKNFEKVCDNLVSARSFYRLSKIHVPFHKFDLSLYSSIINWMAQDVKTHCLCLMGPTRCGKSSLALLLAGERPLIVNERNGLNHFVAGFHTGIIFNDFDWSDAGLHYQDYDDKDDFVKSKLYLNLFDPMIDCTVRVLYGSVQIPGNVFKIVTSNLDLNELFKSNKALHSRFIFVHMTKVIKTRRSGYLSNIIPGAADYAYNPKDLSYTELIQVVVFMTFFEIRCRDIFLENQLVKFISQYYGSSIMTSYDNNLNYLRELNKMLYILKQKEPLGIYKDVDLYEYALMYLKDNNNLGAFVKDLFCMDLYMNYCNLVFGFRRDYTSIINELYP